MKKNKSQIEMNLINLPTATNITYSWNFGSLLGMNLSMQILTGFLISMHYNPLPSEAFKSYMMMSRNINKGMMLKFLHSTGASTFFILILLHIFRAMMNNSFKNKKTWASGNLILITLMATAFLGYVLPWGQMSLWGATVITNLISTIPIKGEFLKTWIWGGFNVDKPTLNRFFSLHFMIPLSMTMMSLLHISSLHKMGSSSNMNLMMSMDKIPFNTYFSMKDLNTMLMVTLFLALTSTSKSFIFSDPMNFSPANPMSTPDQIMPEWYFLFAYAILRSIPNKTGGVIAMIMSIMMLPIMMMKKTKSTTKFNPKNKFNNTMKMSTFISLTFLGSMEIEMPFTLMSMMSTATYFLIMST